MEDMSQLFLGQRIACARCHHHPFEKWSQQDYYGMTAFFSRVVLKEPPPPKGKPKKGEPVPPVEPFSVAMKTGSTQAVNPKTNKPVKPTGLGGKEIQIADDDDPRARLADWMSEKDNPFFARALVNRYWKHFFGRGLVEPEDDLRVTNPATNPELLDALAKHFTEHKYDLKELVRTICSSQVYRLSALPNRHNAEDRQSFSRFLPRRLHAEVLLDAIDGVTQTKTTFKGVPAGNQGGAAAGQPVRLVFPERVWPAGLAPVPASASAARRPAWPSCCTCSTPPIFRPRSLDSEPNSWRPISDRTRSGCASSI